MEATAVLVVLFGVGCLVLSPFAFYQIITKAGYSGWWTFVPYTPWIIGLFGQVAFRTFDTNQSIGTIFDQVTFGFVLTILSGIFVTTMFFVFAFSSWPALQGRQYPRPQRAGFTTLGRGSSNGPTFPVAPMGPAPAAGSVTGAEDVAIGWHRTGDLGSGEQGYWDGREWTARRQWKNGAWIDLPVDAVGPVGGGTTEDG
ncbi:MAG TPA: hypothetical protein VN820_07410 [Acidimicrobiales bacterium]|nr:hypothetical protein [Acidimicrobiales bacterium]